MVHSISPQQAFELLSRGEVEVIDVRDPSEWAGGHLPGAQLVPLERLRASPSELRDRENILFVCAAGVRSQTAARIAASLGVKTIYNLSSGTRGWVKAGFPLVNELSVAV